MRVKAEGGPSKHNEAVVRVQKPTQGLKVKTKIRAGTDITWNTDVTVSVEHH